MILPAYWLPRPGPAPDERAQSAFDALLAESLRAGECVNIEYALSSPKWQFLCHAAEHHDIALHGSGDANIALFEPRQSNDVGEFGNQKAVYAASDGVWAMFFAVVAREQVTSVANACLRLTDAAGETHGPYYFFSVSRDALPAQPWRTGTVYLLPRSTFVTQPPMQFGTTEARIAQLASFVHVAPYAKLTVTPQDFPFLAQIRGHDDARLQEIATALQTGAPLPDDA